MSAGSYIDRPGISTDDGRMILRQHVLVRAYRDAHEETGLAESKFSEDLARAYLASVPEEMRRIDLPDPDDMDISANAYRARMDKLRKRIEAYLSGQWHMPVELEEAWIAALPDRYAQRCKRQLVRRMGFVGVPIQDGGEAATCDLSAANEVISNASEAVQKITTKMLADGVIDEHDQDHAPEVLHTLDNVIAAAIAAKQRVLQRTGYEQVTPIRGAA